MLRGAAPLSVGDTVMQQHLDCGQLCYTRDADPSRADSFESAARLGAERAQHAALLCSTASFDPLERQFEMEDALEYGGP